MVVVRAGQTSATRASGAVTTLGAVAIIVGACGGGKPVQDTGPRVSAVPLTRVPVDSEPDDGVELVSEKGHMDPAVADAGIAPHRSALTRCYTQKLGRRSWLGGRVVLRWLIAVDGAVTSVQIAESDLGAWPIERCLLDIARQVAFGKPVGGPAELTLPLELSTGHTLPIEEALEIIDDGADAAGKAGKTAAGAKVARRAKPARPVGGTKAAKHAKPGAAQPARAADPNGTLDACARSNAAGKPAATAMPDDVTVTLYVGAQGRIESVGFASQASILDDDWAACAETAALAWRAAHSNGQVTKHLLRYRPR